ncbi:MAG: glycosyltransferase family 39 protein [Candidatus Microsaccharimonas sp.]
MKEIFKKKIAFIRSHPVIDGVVVAVGLLIYVAIALFNAPRASIWFDEAFSYYITRFNFLEIAQFTATDVHPPLYYWLLKVWGLGFGMSELAMRSLSIVLGVVVIIVAFLLVRRLFGRLVAGVSLLFLSLSPMLIRYSDEARMYTLASLIVVAASYLLVKATETDQRRWYVLYGILVGLGMWTHYFTALIWIAHWVWRAITIRQSTTKPKLFWKKFFTKNWIIAHVVAIAVFLPWLPFMAIQLGTIQGGGFWIGPVSSDTIMNYFTNIFYYLDHGQAQGWLALLLLGVLGLLIFLAPRVYRRFNRADKKNYLLITIIAFVPVVTLLLLSMPPLRPSFVERYLIPAIVVFALFAAVTIVVGTQKWKPILRAVPIVIIAGMMIFGITNVYKYGNYNKNSNTHILTGELVKDIAEQSEPGIPIIASSPWVFYEAVPYSTDEHPVYFIEANTDYIYGSLDMLKYRDDYKIKDFEAFKKQHPVIWYIGMTGDEDVSPYQASWEKIRTIALYDYLSKKTEYRGTEYKLSAE